MWASRRRLYTTNISTRTIRANGWNLIEWRKCRLLANWTCKIRKTNGCKLLSSWYNRKQQIWPNNFLCVCENEKTYSGKNGWIWHSELNLVASYGIIIIICEWVFHSKVVKIHHNCFRLYCSCLMQWMCGVGRSVACMIVKVGAIYIIYMLHYNIVYRIEQNNKIRELQDKLHSCQTTSILHKLLWIIHIRETMAHLQLDQNCIYFSINLEIWWIHTYSPHQ